MDKMFRMEKGSKFDTNPYLFVCFIYLVHRVVGRSENPGVPVLFDEHSLPPLVEIGLTDLPKYGVAMTPQAPQGTTGLLVRGWFSVRICKYVHISQVINHMTCYNSCALIDENLFSQKNPLQDLISGLNTVISTKESIQIFVRSCDLQPGSKIQQTKIAVTKI